MSPTFDFYVSICMFLTTLYISNHCNITLFPVFIYYLQIEDAQASMLLYLRQKKEWESQVKAQRKRKPKLFENSSFKLN